MVGCHFETIEIMRDSSYWVFFIGYVFTMSTFNIFVLLFFQAFRVSLGKLGIITAIKMKIVQEQPVSRTQSRGILPSQFIGMLRDAQEMYKTTRSLPQWMNETQVFWIVQNHEVML